MSRPVDWKRVSVVIANYNMGKYLPEAIDSVLAQTYPVHEINVVDDGSTDNTREVAERYRDESRVRWHFQENGGQARAKNKGVLESTGEFVGFCDADDMWAPDKLERQMPCFDLDSAIGVVHTNFVLIKENGDYIGTPKRDYHDGWISGQLLIDNFVNGMASVIRKDCFDKVGLFEETLPMGIDYDLWLRISAHYKFQFVDTKAYLYRQWEGQMSHRHTKRFECAVRIMNKFLETHPGLVDGATVREAWAHTYVGRGRGLWAYEKDRRGAMQHYLKALRCKPLYFPAWMSILRILAGR